MKAMEGVRKITNRMELIQGLRNKLMKTRLTLIIVAVMFGASLIANVKLVNELKEERDMSANLTIELNEVKNTNSKLEQQVKEAKQEIDRLNSFENKMTIALELEDIVREAVGGIQSITKNIRHYMNSTDSINTDIQSTDYVLNEVTGETVKVIENKDNMFVVYVPNSETEELLESSLSRQYYLGTEDYYKAINEIEDTVIIRHDLK